MLEIFGGLKNYHYLCTRQLVILIYIYHFPTKQPGCEVRLLFSFSPFCVPLAAVRHTPGVPKKKIFLAKLRYSDIIIYFCI